MKSLSFGSMKYLAFAAAACAVLNVWGAEPLWLRHTNINPQGTEIAFTFRGDIYTVPAEGGRAVRLTSSEAYECFPFYSPDGSRIAFSSNRDGNTRDVYVMSATGGTPVRLTTHSGNENVRGWLNDSTVLFSADIMPSPQDLNGPFFAQLYAVESVPGRRPRQVASVQADALDVNAAGDVIFQNHKSYENLWRKHEVSSGTPDVYMLRGGEYTRLSEGDNASRNPVWLASDRYAYTWDGDADSTLNIYEASVGSAERRKLTHFDRHPVRYLSAAADGSLLAFSHDGNIYTLRPGGEPVKLEVEIVADNYDSDYVKHYTSFGADNLSISPEGKEVAFTIRGDLYVTNEKYETTKRITNTPGQERISTFAKDGRSIVYDGERDGRWKLYISRLTDDADKNFAYANGPVVEEELYECEGAAQQPVFSPDGKKVAFLEDRTAIRVLDVDSREVVTALDGRYNYSYQDGDVYFTWSPDSKWLLTTYIGIGGWMNDDIALVKADGSEVVDLTESGYSDSEPRWALDGKAITYSTAKYGMRSHGSWGNESDVMLMVLDAETWDKFHRTKEEIALDEEAEKNSESDDSDDDSASSKKKKKKNKAEAAAPEVTLDLANRRHRMERLTERSSRMWGHFLNPKGTALYYLAGSTEGAYKLYKHDLLEDETSVVAGGLTGAFEADAKGENLYFLTATGIRKFNLDSESTEDIEYDAVYDRRPSLEREYIYDHAYQQVKDKFYDADLGGVDWDGYYADYRKFLPSISNNTDFAELLSELLGELNASHTGGYYSGSGNTLTTASLGAYYDPEYSGDGLRVLELLPLSPLANTKAAIEPGDIITAIDGRTIAAGADYFPLLEGKANRNTRISVTKADGTTKTVTVKPLRSDGRQQYNRWVEHNEKLVDSLSGGRIGYVHVEDMDSPSFRTAYDRILGKYRNADAVIVDTRFNSGGWLHNDLAVLLGGREYVRFIPRGQYVGSEPFSQWYKPSVMLVNEANYSDAYGGPYAYQALGLGELVGAPVPGTMTAVWWENQIDSSLMFGIPQVANCTLEGQPLENVQLQPEVTVYNTPAETTAGNDLQIQAAVNRLLQKISNE